MTNKPAFDAAEKHLHNLGHVVLNPARHGLVDGKGWSFYMRLAIADLLQADAIAQLDGWHTSRGAILENRIAQELGLAHVDAGVVA